MFIDRARIYVEAGDGGDGGVVESAQTFHVATA